MAIQLKTLVSCLREEITALNQEREADNLAPIAQVHLKLLGQSALMFNPVISQQLTLIQTRDLDAIIEGDWSSRSLVKRAISRLGLEYDDLSKEIWIPPGAQFISLFEDNIMKLEALDPFYTFLSKAVKAPEKNKQLIVQALFMYGDALAQAITAHGGETGFFIDD
jgi:hypothetical protein